jgi:hypothetical protein
MYGLQKLLSKTVLSSPQHCPIQHTWCRLQGSMLLLLLLLLLLLVVLLPAWHCC